MTGTVKNKPKSAGAKTSPRSSTKGRAASARAARRRRNRHRGRRSGLTMWIVIGALFVVGAALIIAVVSQRGSSSGAAARTPVSAALMHSLTSVPESVSARRSVAARRALFDNRRAGAHAGRQTPRPVRRARNTAPTRAAERWGLVIALSAIRDVSGLKTTASSPADVNPNTPTFSFHDATYTSPYLAFDGVETNSNVLAGGNYATLDVLSSSQQQLMAKYDTPPYVPSSRAGTIPFSDLGGKFLISGAAYDPATLSGKSAQEIADLLTDPSKASTQGILGTANHITAALCTLTDNQPASACNNATIKKLQASPGTTGSSGSSKVG